MVVCVDTYWVVAYGDSGLRVERVDGVPHLRDSKTGFDRRILPSEVKALAAALAIEICRETVEDQ